KFIRLGFYGASALFAVSYSNPAAVRLIGHGLDDQLGLADPIQLRERNTFPVQSLIETRGYAQAFEEGRVENQPRHTALSLATLGPSISVDQINDGSFGSELPLTPAPIMRDRTKWEIQKPAYSIDNSQDNAEDPRRLDYSVIVGDNAVLGTGIR